MIPLEQNYRSTNAILNASNAVIENNRERKKKHLWSELGEGEPVRVVETEDEHAEARFVAAEVAGLVEYGTSLGEIAVVYRTNAQSRVLEDVFVRQGVDYQVIGGPRFYERAEIKDAIAYLQAIDNPYDGVSLSRIANKPRRGVGDTSLARLQALADGEGISLWEAVGRAEEAGLATASLRAVQGWRTLLQSLMAQALELSIAGAARGDRRAHRLPASSCSRRSRSGRPRGRSRTSRSSSASRASTRRTPTEPSLSAFLQEISLYSDQDALRDDEGGGQVTLMTLHNAKGLEFRAVFMLGMEEGIFPHSRSLEENSLEEERRLCYVGMTRAKEKLTMLHASRRSLYGRSDANLPSRFLDELPEEGVERERLRPASWSNYGVPVARREVTPRADVPVALDRRLGAPRHARRRDRHEDRAGRRDHGALRGRLGEAADARVRRAREDLDSPPNDVEGHCPPRSCSPLALAAALRSAAASSVVQRQRAARLLDREAGRRRIGGVTAKCNQPAAPARARAAKIYVGDWMGATPKSPTLQVTVAVYSDSGVSAARPSTTCKQGLPGPPRR